MRRGCVVSGASSPKLMVVSLSLFWVRKFWMRQVFEKSFPSNALEIIILQNESLNSETRCVSASCLPSIVMSVKQKVSHCLEHPFSVSFSLLVFTLLIPQVHSWSLHDHDFENNLLRLVLEREQHKALSFCSLTWGQCWHLRSRHSINSWSQVLEREFEERERDNTMTSLSGNSCWHEVCAAATCLLSC